MMTFKSKMLVFPILLVFYEIATYLSNDMYLPALPEMMRDLSLSTQQAQLTLTSWFIGSATLPLVLGVVSDRYGRRPVLLTGGVIYVLSTIVCALAANPQQLLIARFIEGAALPSMMVAGYACIHESFGKKDAIRILALMGSITVLAPALGPLLGSIILYFSSWRGIFWVIAIWAAINLSLLFHWMPETHPPEKRKPIHLRSMFSQYGRVLCNKQFMMLLFVQGLIFTGFISFLSAGPLLIIETFNYSPIAYGIMQAIIFSAYVFGNYWVKHLLDSTSIKRLIWSGLGITLFGGALLFLFATVLPASLYPFVIAITIYSLGSALCFPPLNRTIIESSSESMGIRVSLYTVLWTGFAVLGSSIASFVFDGSIRSVAFPIAILAVLSCGLMFTCGFKEQQREVALGESS